MNIVNNIIKKNNNIPKIFIRNFKRPVTNSDFDPKLKKKLFNKNKYNVDKEKRTDNDKELFGKDLYTPEYGCSHYEPQKYHKNTNNKD